MRRMLPDRAVSSSIFWFGTPTLAHSGPRCWNPAPSSGCRTQVRAAVVPQGHGHAVAFDLVQIRRRACGRGQRQGQQADRRQQAEKLLFHFAPPLPCRAAGRCAPALRSRPGSCGRPGCSRSFSNPLSAGCPAPGRSASSGRAPPAVRRHGHVGKACPAGGRKAEPHAQQRFLRQPARAGKVHLHAVLMAVFHRAAQHLLQLLGPRRVAAEPSVSAPPPGSAPEQVAYRTPSVFKTPGWRRNPGSGCTAACSRSPKGPPPPRCGCRPRCRQSRARPTSALCTASSAEYRVICTLSRLASYSAVHSSFVSRRPLVFSRVTNHWAASTSSTRSGRRVGSPPVKVTWGTPAFCSFSRISFHWAVVSSSVSPWGWPAA